MKGPFLSARDGNAPTAPHRDCACENRAAFARRLVLDTRQPT